MMVGCLKISVVTFVLALGACAAELNSSGTLEVKEADINGARGDTPGITVPVNHGTASTDVTATTIEPIEDAETDSITDAIDAKQDVAVVTQSLSLKFDSLKSGNGIVSHVNEIQYVAKNERGLTTFMGCDAKTWTLEDATGITRKVSALKHAALDNKKVDCWLQVKPKRFWGFSSQGVEHRLSFSSLSESSDESVEVTSVKLLFPETLSSRPRALSVNASEVVFFIDGKIQYYQLIDNKSSGQKREIKVVQFSWDTATKGAPVASGSVGLEYWVATKEQIFWLQASHGANGALLGHQWSPQPLSIAPFTREELGALFIKGMGLYVVPGEKSLQVLGRAAILQRDKVLISQDHTWELLIKHIAVKACARCHAETSLRAWKDPSSYDAWAGSWRSRIKSQLDSRLMPTPGSKESIEFSSEERLALVDWLAGLNVEVAGEIVEDLATVPEPPGAPGNAPLESPKPSEQPLDVEPYRAEWNASIQPVVASDCANSSCHTSSFKTQLSTLEDFSRNAALIRGTLNGSGLMRMPPGSPATFSATDESLLLNFVEKLLDGAAK